MPTEARTEDEKAPIAAAFKAATVNRGWPGGLAALASRRRYNMLAVTGEFSRKPSPVMSRHGLGDICPQCGKEEAFLAAGFKNAVEKALPVQRLEDEMRKKVDLMNAGKLPASEVINSYDQ